MNGMPTTSRLIWRQLSPLLWLLLLLLLVNIMFGLGGKQRTAMQVRREMNNKAAQVLRNPTEKNKKELEALRQEYNSFSKKKKK